MVTENWHYLENTYGLLKVGVIILKQTFQEDQDILKLLPYAQDPKLFNNATLKEHANFITQCISKCIEHLSDLDSQAAEMKQYGKQLMELGIQQEQYQAMKQAMINTITMGLQDKMNKDINHAWLNLLKFTSEMLISNNYEIQENQSEFSLYELSQQEIFTLKETWNKLEKFDLMMIGRQIFSKLTTMNQEVQRDFYKLYGSNMFVNEQFIRHCTKVVKFIGQSIHQLDDLENLAQFLASFDIQIKPQYFNDFVNSFIEVIQSNLKKEEFP